MNKGQLAKGLAVAMVAGSKAVPRFAWVESVTTTPPVPIPNRREPDWATPEVTIGFAEKKNVGAMGETNGVLAPEKL